MSVITISRELGSEGSLIAKKVAEALGYHLADKKTIETILKDYGLGDFDETYRTIPGFWDRFDVEKRERRQTLLSMLNHCIEALACHGEMVIVGRGGFAVLAGLSDALHVRIKAPLAVRCRRVAELSTVGEISRAEDVVNQNDQLQKAFVKSVYGVEWDSETAFDLVLDTGKITSDLAAGLIVESARELHAGVGRTTRDLDVDKILFEAVEELMSRQPAVAG